MARLAVSGLALALLALAAVVAGAGEASAHPLGALSVNRYARVEVAAEVARVHYVVDLAEIPAYRARRAVDADPNGYLARRVADAKEGLELTVDGRRLDLATVDGELNRPRGNGGVRRVRIDAVFEGRLPPSQPDEVLTARLTDRNEPERIGWREMVVAAAGDATVVWSSVPRTDASDALRDYPDPSNRAPLDVRAASFRFTPGTEPVAAGRLDGLVTGSTGPSDPLARLMGRDGVTPLALLGMLGVAGLVGAGHALAPGHGKTVMAAYLVGSQSRPVDALAAGVIVAGMHTASVLALGGVLLQVDHALDLTVLYPALTLASGTAVTAVGVWLLVGRVRTVRATRRGHGERPQNADDGRAGHGHAHGPAGHADPGRERADHAYDGHQHGHRHELPAGVAPLSRRGLVALASSGGLVPSPSAVLVVVSAFALGRLALGLGLVLAFSLGLAATLTVVGLALLVGSRAFRGRWGERVARAAPLVGAGVLPLLGLLLVLQGVRAL